MDAVCRDGAQAQQLAELRQKTGVALTVHHKLPLDHSDESVEAFYATVDRFAEWQKQYGCMEVLSFDVHEEVRDNVAPYVEYVLSAVPHAKIALEDFGLTAAEREQIEHLKAEPRFGYLIDIGHMYIRICGKNSGGFDPFYQFFGGMRGKRPANKGRFPSRILIKGISCF